MGRHLLEGPVDVLLVAVGVGVAMKVGATVVDVDLNHPMAGKMLQFEVEIVDVREALPVEIEHGHVHGEGGIAH